MGQKSRSKRKNHPKPAVRTVSVPVAEGPSLVQSSTTFQMKAKPGEDLLQVRRSDIVRVGVLLVITAVLFIALGVADAHSTVFLRAGTRISHALGF